MKTYLVGGAVRDQLLGLEPREHDWVVVGASPQQLLDQGYLQVGKSFPVFLHPNTRDEYALARTERKIAPGYTGFEFSYDTNVTLEEDLRRRDLTINAIARDEQGQLVDPYQGARDLEQGILRHVSEAFAEDPVRILRVARFAARFHHLGFTIAEETLALMRTMVDNGEVNALIAERVWKELEKALGTDNPQVFIDTLRRCGALEKLFPEIDRLFGIPQKPTYHPEVDTGIHTLMVLQQAARLSHDLTIRFAALVHDLGKGTTPVEALPSHKGHEERTVPLVQQLCRRLRAPKHYQQLAEQVARYHLYFHRAFELKPATLLKLFKGLGALQQPQRLALFLTTCEADSRGRTGMEDNNYDAQKAHFEAALNAALSVDTNEIVQAGFEGKAFADELHQRRVSAIKHSWHSK